MIWKNNKAKRKDPEGGLWILRIQRRCSFHSWQTRKTLSKLSSWPKTLEPSTRDGRKPILIRNNFHNVSWVLKVEWQAYNNEEMWKILGIPKIRMQKVTADFPQQLCDQITQLECVASPRYNPSIWLLGCDRKAEIRTQHPHTSQLLYPFCVAEIFSRLPVQTGRLENVFLSTSKDHYSRATPTSFRR